MPHNGEALDRPTIFLSPTRQTSKPDAINTTVSAQGTRVWQADPPAPVQVARSARARVPTAISRLAWVPPKGNVAVAQRPMRHTVGSRAGEQFAVDMRTLMHEEKRAWLGMQENH